MSEISDTAVLVRLGAEGSYYLLKGAVKGFMHQLQTFKKMKRANILQNGEVEDFEKFLKATEGQYKILNIPTEDPEKIAKIKEDLDKLHIGYHMLPDLNVGDGQIQIAYAVQDTDKIGSWYQSFCLDNLQGGEKSFNDLYHFTDGQVSIVNIPWPDADTPEEEAAEEFEKLKEDLSGSRFQFPYGIMPDLDKKDKHVQIIAPSYRAEEIQDWFAYYMEWENHGKDTISAEIPIVTLEDYLQSGEMDPYAYVDTASKELKEKLEPEKSPQKQAPPAEKTETPTDPAGGEKTLDDLLTITKGNVSVASLHFPDPAAKEKNAEKTTEKTEEREPKTERAEPRPPKAGPGLTREENLQRLKDDLDKLHVNYTILPDLNVGDGYVQVAFATADAPKIKAWYEAYQNDMLAAGMPVNDLKEMSLEDYMATGKSDGPAAGKGDVPRKEEAPRKENASGKGQDAQREGKPKQSEYEQLKARPGMVELSINKSLVQNADAMSPEGFASRIPGTYETLYIKPDILYQTDDGKTYSMLADKNTKVQIQDRQGNMREATLGDVQEHYGPVRGSMAAAPKTVLYRKSEDSSPNVEPGQPKTQPGGAKQKPKDTQSRNKFNNFHQREYSEGFYADLERQAAQELHTGILPEKTGLEKTLDRMEWAQDTSTTYVHAGDFDGMPWEGMQVYQPIGTKELENGSVLFVAQTNRDEYFTGIADAVERKEDGSLGRVAVGQDKEITVVDKYGDKLKMAKMGDLAKEAAPQVNPKDVAAKIQKPLENALKGPKL